MADKNENESESQKSNPELLSLLRSWDVETYLEESDSEETVCKYFSTSGTCPYQEVGCMFLHEKQDNNVKEDQEELELKCSDQGLVKGAKLFLNPYFFGWLEK